MTSTLLILYFFAPYYRTGTRSRKEPTNKSRAKPSPALAPQLDSGLNRIVAPSLPPVHVILQKVPDVCHAKLCTTYVVFQSSACTRDVACKQHLGHTNIPNKLNEKPKPTPHNHITHKRIHERKPTYTCIPTERAKGHGPPPRGPRSPREL